jgi:prevent-host-death family protein
MSNATQTRRDSAQLYTMRELNQHTADVIREINESGQPAVITRHGRFVAIISPLTGTDVETVALSAIIENATNRPQLLGQRTTASPETAEELAQNLGITLPAP